MPSDLSHMFNKNLIFLQIFGIWAGRTPLKYYKYYSLIYLFVTCLCYNLLLFLNLLYTPPKIDLLLREFIFYFTEITITSKVIAILLMRNKLIEALNVIDCDEFMGDYQNKNGILYKTSMRYQLGWKLYAILCNVVYSSQVFVPIFLNSIRGTKSELPICKYYFLSDERRESYFLFWYIYQSFGMYGHMTYNVNVDSMTAGFLLVAINQLRLLNINLSNFKLSGEENNLPIELREKIQITRLHKYLRHYEVILKYCETIQEMLSATLFCQISVASIIICVVMCGLVLPSSTETFVFMVMYFFTMTLEIYVPLYLGTQLTYESQELVIAAYNSEWIPRSGPFKSSMILFVERAKTPIVVSGLKMVPLSLVTFTTIIKSAYSFFALIRTVQDREE